MTIREFRHDERDLATAIRLGAQRRPLQAFGHYFEGARSSCALGAAYEGIYRLPADAGRPRQLGRLIVCLEKTVRICPEGCRKRLPLASIIVHLNDDHHWDREQIAAWLAGPQASPAANA
jgi:hypothetical protein